MRSLRMQKLAEIRKVAAVYFTNNRNYNNFNTGFYNATDGSVLYFDKTLEKWYLALDNDGKITGRVAKDFTPIRSGESYDVTTAMESTEAQDKFVQARGAKTYATIYNDSNFKLKVSLNKEVDGRAVSESSVDVALGDMYTLKPDQDISLKLINSNVGDKRFKPNTFKGNETYYVSKLLDLGSSVGAKKEDSGRKRSSGVSGQTTGGEILIAESHRGLTGLVDTGNRDYVYTTASNGASATYTYRGSPGKTLDKNYSRWAEFVGKINKLSTDGATKAAPPAPTAPATEAATAGQTTGGETAPATTPVDNLTINVARLLSNVDAGHTYAGKTIFTNERGMVRGMLAAIGKIYDNYESKGITVVGDAPLALARMIVGMKRSTLERSALASFDSGQLSSMGEKEIEKTFRGDLDIIMRAVVDIHNRLGGKPGYGKLENYLGIKGGTRRQVGGVSPTNAPAPAPPKEEADDDTKKNSSRIDPRIKKLATLRRLRVRSQMEAAVESSAQLGRFRIS
jgi:hypothetical protein